VATDFSTSRGRRRAVTVVLTLVVLIALTIGYRLWWSRPSAFGGPSASTALAKEAVGTTYSVNMFSVRPGETVTLRRAKPVVRADSTDADIDVVVCRHRDADLQLGAGTDSLEKWCAATSPVDGYVLRGSSPGTAIYLRVTPRQVGTISIDGLDLTYRRHGVENLLQTGTERAGVRLRLTAVAQ
jgi:hypothetical protein